MNDSVDETPLITSINESRTTATLPNVLQVLVSTDKGPLNLRITGSAAQELLGLLVSLPLPKGSP